MRRLPTMLMSASAATLTTVAITVAVPAIADNGSDGGGTRSAEAFATCLRGHGLPGAPGVTDLKPWLGARLERGDAAAKRAMAACDPKPAIAVDEAGPSEQELRSCLAGHGVAVPAGDGMVLKRWLLEHGDDATNRDAMKACGIAPVSKPAGGGACFKEGAGRPAVRGGN